MSHTVSVTGPIQQKNEKTLTLVIAGTSITKCRGSTLELRCTYSSSVCHYLHFDCGIYYARAVQMKRWTRSNE